MKTANGVENPLAEWTLKEVQQLCVGTPYSCDACQLKERICDCSPEKWKLEEKPKFTDQEIEDAKTLMRVFCFEKTSGNLSRESDGRLVVVINRGGLRGINTYEVINSELFPSINRKEHFTFSAIIGDEDA